MIYFVNQILLLILLLNQIKEQLSYFFEVQKQNKANHLCLIPQAYIHLSHTTIFPLIISVSFGDEYGMPSRQSALSSSVFQSEAYLSVFRTKLFSSILRILNCLFFYCVSSFIIRSKSLSYKIKESSFLTSRQSSKGWAYRIVISISLIFQSLFFLLGSIL